MYREIPLKDGHVAIVDAADYDWLMEWNWYLYKNQGGVFYARGRRKGTHDYQQLMHRVILNVPRGVLVDHRDRNTLHNWRENLRIATTSQNTANQAPKIDRRTGLPRFKGVFFRGTKRNPWRASIGYDGEVIRLGTYPTAEAAALAYDVAALAYFGEFAVVNFPAANQLYFNLRAVKS